MKKSEKKGKKRKKMKKYLLPFLAKQSQLLKILQMMVANKTEEL